MCGDGLSCFYSFGEILSFFKLLILHAAMFCSAAASDGRIHCQVTKLKKFKSRTYNIGITFCTASIRKKVFFAFKRKFKVDFGSL